MEYDPFNRSVRYRSGQVNGVYFDPWIGKDYGVTSRWGTSVLVIAESHYESCDERWGRGDLLPRDTSTFVATKWAEEVLRYHFATKIAISFLGKNPSRNPPHGEMFRFWHSLCFYNFIQEGVGHHNKESPTQEAVVSGREGFRTIMAELKPHLVVVFSRLVWCALQLDNPRTGAVSEWTENGVLMIGLPHPCSRKFGNARDWHPKILESLNRAREETQKTSTSI